MRTGLTGDGHKVRMDDRDFNDIWIKYVKWHRNTKGYVFANAPRQYGKHLYLHQLIGQRMGIEGEVDHKNRDVTDNRRENLRAATSQQSATNRGPSRNKVGRYKGVYLDKKTGKWRAIVTDHGVRYDLGSHWSEDEAARVRDARTRQLHGEFAYLNGV